MNVIKGQTAPLALEAASWCLMDLNDEKPKQPHASNMRAHDCLHLRREINRIQHANVASVWGSNWPHPKLKSVGIPTVTKSISAFCIKVLYTNWTSERTTTFCSVQCLKKHWFSTHTHTHARCMELRSLLSLKPIHFGNYSFEASVFGHALFEYIWYVFLCFFASADITTGNILFVPCLTKFVAKWSLQMETWLQLRCDTSKSEAKSTKTPTIS